MRLGATCILLFAVELPSVIGFLLERIALALDSGSIYAVRIDRFDLYVSGLSTITSKIIPVFTSHP